MSVFEAARDYADAGFSVVPVLTDGTKKPAARWKVYQERTPTLDELRKWFCVPDPPGIALAHGAVSGNSEVIDFDIAAAYEEFAALCETHGYSGLLGRMGQVLTPSGGRHLYYRCPTVEQNQKLARLPDGVTKIETRGEGGYTIAPGSPVAVHPSGMAYQWRTLHYSANITEDEREALLSFGRACNERIEPKDTHRVKAASTTLGDDYNARADVLPLLLAHGWQEAGRRGDIIDLTRPGKSTRLGISATLNHVAPGVLYVFSSSCPPFEPGHAYPPFSIYGLLEHDGDFKEAASVLAEEGYGAPKRFSVPVSLGEDATQETTAPPDIPLTDLGNAERLVARFGDGLRHCAAIGWLAWDGARWAGDETGEETRRMMATVRAMRTDEAPAVRQAKKPNEEAAYKRAAAIEEYSFKSESAGKIEAALKLARAVRPIPIDADQLDADAYLLNCRNGTVDLRTGELRPHDRADYLTKILPVGYDPAAVCPNWDRFMARVLPDEDIRLYIQRVIGYCLTGDVSEQCIFFLYGSGSNGKSTFLKTILTLMAGYGKQASSELLVAKKGEMVRDDVAGLAGKRFVATIEVDDGRAMAEGLVKQLSGGDRITARFLYKNAFEFDPTFKIVLAANHKPIVKGADYGIWRRIRVIPFVVTIPDEEKDVHLDRKLIAELPGILAWAVRGCREWREGGMRTPDAVQAFTQEYRQESDLMGLFFAEECELSASLQIRPAALYEAYCRWCEGRRERAKSMTAFGRAMGERGIGKVTVNGYPHYVGVGLKGGETDEPETGLWGQGKTVRVSL